MKRKSKKWPLDAIHQLSFGQKIEIEIFSIIIILVIGMFIFHMIEEWRYLDALYFTVTTIAAIGYGDFVPKTDLGKIVTMFYEIIGMPLFIYTSALLVERRLMKKKLK